jgi:putative GTP pyrophosphokinase
MPRKEEVEKLVSLFIDRQDEFDIFLNATVAFFQRSAKLNKGNPPAVHSLKYRLKDPEHLTDKLNRKLNGEESVDEQNFFQKITDLAGIRVIHLYQGQLEVIDEAIRTKVNSGDWVFVEPPKAHTWDREAEHFFKTLKLEVVVKESLYTSIHYLIRSPSDKDLCCEIQVRNLFEEAWGEIDHTINYPKATDSVACREQLRVLAKVVGAGSRLAESIFRSYVEHATLKR